MALRSTLCSQLLVHTQIQEESFLTHVPSPRDIFFPRFEGRFWFQLSQSCFPNLAFSSNRQIKKNQFNSEKLKCTVFLWADWLGRAGIIYLCWLPGLTHTVPLKLRSFVFYGWGPGYFNNHTSPNKWKNLLRTGLLFLKGKSWNTMFDAN